MNEQQIRALVQKEIAGAAASGRFRLAPIQRHIHNNIDSPYVFHPVMNYIGEISSAGSEVTLPNGWTVSRTSTGIYTITHNLGSSYYQVVANSNTNIGVFTCITVKAGDYFTVRSFVPDGTSYTPTDSGVGFVLTIANNRSETMPSYT